MSTRKGGAVRFDEVVSGLNQLHSGLRSFWTLCENGIEPERLHELHERVAIISDQAIDVMFAAKGWGGKDDDGETYDLANVLPLPPDRAASVQVDLLTLLDAVQRDTDDLFPDVPPSEWPDPEHVLKCCWAYGKRHMTVADRLLDVFRSLPQAGSTRSDQSLSPGRQAVWNALNGRALKAKALADELDTSEQTIKEHVAKIRAIKSSDAIQNKSGWGYYRPDAEPDWDALKPERKRRVRPR